MSLNTSQQEAFEMVLDQMGAKIEKIQGILSHVSFEIENVRISYLYHVNEQEEYHLQRLEPYVSYHDVLKDEEALLSFIKNDLANFVNASKSSVFNKFVSVNQKIQKTLENMEQLFLEKNVSSADMDTIDELLETINTKAHEIREKSPDIKFDKKEVIKDIVCNKGVCERTER